MTWGFIFIVIAFFCFLFQHYFFFGIAIGVLTISFNIDTPYKKTFKNCSYQATLLRPNYSTSYNNKYVLINAKNILCKNYKLKNQQLQIWDSKDIFKNNLNSNLEISSDLLPIAYRLNFMDFDYEKFLISSGVRLIIKNPKIIKKSIHRNYLYKIRNIFAKNISKNLSSKSAGLVLALVTGNRTGLSSEQKNILKNTGTSHLIAISGLHLSLLGGIAWLIGQYLCSLSWRLSSVIMPIKFGAIFAFTIISAYALLTGFHIPVKRAWIMYSLLIFSWLLFKNISIQPLLIAAIIVILISPYSLLSVGFYFSFIATFIIIWCLDLKYPPLIKAICAQFLIGIVLMPITWYTFGVISISSFFVNLLVIPWLGAWILPWAVIACILSSFSITLSSPFWYFVDLSTDAMWQTINVFSNLNLSFYPTFSPTLGAVIISVVSIFIALIFKKKWFFSLFLIVFLPIKTREPASIIIADSNYTSALIHNSKEAIIINPGRRYKNINQAQKWYRYMQKYKLNLKVIILQNKKLSIISSTRWLLDKYPKAKVISLSKFQTPFQKEYCKSYHNKGLSVNNYRLKNTCKSSLTWGKNSISLFSNSKDNSILNNSTLVWQGKSFNTKKLGAIKITYYKSNYKISYTRQNNRIWRLPVKP